MSRYRVIVTLGAVIFSVLCIASTMPKTAKSRAVTRIVIDAGHGGKDPGNLGTGRYKITEKTVALNVARKVGGYISEAFPDVEVLYTRSDDTFIPLHERTKFANTKGADLFLSIHCDAFTKESAHGAGSYVMGPAKTEANLRAARRENSAILLEDNRDENYGDFDPNSPEGLIELSLRQNTHIHQSLKFAKHVQDQFRTRVGRTDRGVRQAPYWVISFTTMPSVLVELGFLTNKEEEDFLISEQGQDYLASAVYRAFKVYKTELEKIEASKEAERSAAAEAAPADEKSAPDDGEKTPSQAVFRVQLLSSSKQVETTPENFSGLKGVLEFEDDGMYKYLWGSASDYDTAKDLQKNVRKTGYKGAFIVAFDQNGKRIPLKEALEAQTANEN
ncbi:MAG: N-acetylmuramoyl-L-alanine amidase [Cryomorphaceae bacterium]|nr:N-acetylmuramoyl-L-alanine amidase [Flavobacteriales bacterium]